MIIIMFLALLFLLTFIVYFCEEQNSVVQNTYWDDIRKEKKCQKVRKKKFFSK